MQQAAALARHVRLKPLAEAQACALAHWRALANEGLLSVDLPEAHGPAPEREREQQATTSAAPRRGST